MPNGRPINRRLKIYIQLERPTKKGRKNIEIMVSNTRLIASLFIRTFYISKEKS